VAVGSRPRGEVPNHVFLGEELNLRRRALALEVTARDAGAKIQITVAVTNVGAGHDVPTGAPEHELVLRATIVANDKRAVDEREWIYTRKLVDDAGKRVPFYLATRLGSDTRLLPKATSREVFDLEAKEAGELRVQAWFRAMSRDIGSFEGVTAPDELMAEAHIDFGPPRQRTSLPKTVRVEP
jgi:hypothetical protein